MDQARLDFGHVDGLLFGGKEHHAVLPDWELMTLEVNLSFMFIEEIYSDSLPDSHTKVTSEYEITSNDLGGISVFTLWLTAHLVAKDVQAKTQRV